jgi:dTDP-4-amino-4,6-dideoxygalactose transaminase
MSEPSEAVGTPFLPFHRPWFGEEELEQLRQALQSGWLTRGPKTLAFEEAFRRYIGAAAAVGVNSATSGLHLALVTLGIGTGDEVITTPITFAATPNEIEHAGARPIFVDVDPTTWLIDPQRVAEAITPRTKAIMPVHLYGQSCDMDVLRDIARTHDLCIVEDAAHAIESTWKDEKIGTIGDITVFSFYPTKNISTGEGGMLTTMDSDLAERASRLAMHGNSKDAWKRYSDSGFSHYMLEERGYKYHMFDLLAAIGLAQLPKIQAWWERRSVLWRRYDEVFRDMPGIRPIPHIMPGRHAYHLYVIEIDPITAGIERDALMQALQADGIGVGVHYVGMHLQPYYRTRYGFRPEDFPVATRASQRMLSLPLYPRLTDAEQERIVTTVARLIRSLH